ncbi:addiction module antidote protein, HigA family [Candidatus Brocadia pituitae]|nr:addiction module antidote protein, HigA family [Candidatus Brocadia pituitae]
MDIISIRQLIYYGLSLIEGKVIYGGAYGSHTNTERANPPWGVLLEEFLIPMSVTQRELAKEIHVPYQRINEIINKRRGVTPSTVLRLAKFFGVSEDFWMNLQLRWDI